MRKKKYIIGLTGNIATGKSTAAKELKSLGASAIDADQVAHQLMQQGKICYQRIVEIFPGVIGQDKEIDRQKLGQIVFKDKKALRRLEEIVHPAVGAEIARRITQTSKKMIVIEAIKLIEAGLHHTCDTLWVTTCPSEQQITRLMKERSMSLEEAKLRVEAQPSQAEKIRLADIVIDTAGTLAQTRKQVRDNWQNIYTGAYYE